MTSKRIGLRFISSILAGIRRKIGSGSGGTEESGYFVNIYRKFNKQIVSLVYTTKFTDDESTNTIDVVREYLDETSTGADEYSTTTASLTETDLGDSVSSVDEENRVSADRYQKYLDETSTSADEYSSTTSALNKLYYSEITRILLTPDQWWTVGPVEIQDSPLELPPGCMPEEDVCHVGLWFEAEGPEEIYAHCNIQATGTYTHIYVWIGVHVGDLPQSGGVEIACNGNPIWTKTEEEFSDQIFTNACLLCNVPLNNGEPVTDPEILITRYHYMAYYWWFDIWVGPVVLYRQ